ncbi:MAG: hypothetical protein HY602_02055, partial [Parcubacteria group bacterium]|nr:hypothetical protein [Parcubacteria group bacterium]
YCNDPRWFINLTKKALIILGTEDSNRALKCYPFAAGEGSDAAFLQPNLWDNKEFAFIINSDNPLVLKEFTYMFDNESLGNLRSEAFYVYHIATEVGVYAALGVGVATIVLASGGTALPASVALAIDISSNIAFASKAADDCIINNRGWGGCAASFLGVIVPFTIKFVREVMPKLREASVLSNLDDVKPLLEKGYLNDLRGFAGNNIFTKNVWTADEHRWAAKGMDELLQGGKISEIPAISNNAISREGFTVSIRSLGRLKSDGAQISSGFIDGLRGANNPGHFAELQRGVRIMEEIPNTQTRAIGLSHTFNGKTTDLDVVAQIKGSNDAIVESVKTGAFRAQEIQKSISDLGIRKNSIAQLNDGTQLTIKEVNLEVEESISNQLTPELNELAERLGVGVKKFTAVR